MREVADILAQILQRRAHRRPIVRLFHIGDELDEAQRLVAVGIEQRAVVIGADVGLGKRTLEQADEARVDREQFNVTCRGEVTAVHPYPISIEWPLMRKGLDR